MKKAIGDNGERSLVVQPPSATELAPHPDVAVVEQEVSLLREDCTRLLRELEERYAKARRVPEELRQRASRIYATLVALERALVGLLRERAVEIAVGALVVGTLVALLPSERRGDRRIRWATRLLS